MDIVFKYENCFSSLSAKNSVGGVVFNLIDKRVVDKIYKNYEITSINY